jgi:hypothetical protein
MKAKKVTDKMLFSLAEGRILTSYGDFELKKFQPNLVPGKPTLPAVPGGIFDSSIFGSPYSERCDCGFTIGRGNTCEKCHSHINTEEEMLSAVGLIKTPVYYIQTIYMEALNNLINSTFKGSYEFDMDTLYTSFFTYDKENDSLDYFSYSNVENPDFTTLSIEGLIKIFEAYKVNKLESLMELVHTYILVQPVAMRPWSYTYKSWLGTRTLDKHQLNFQYQSLIYISTELINQINLTELSVEDIVYSLAAIRLAITKICDGISGLINTSKASSIRQGFGVRVPNSARGVALADPNLNIDQVSLPIGMCFEIFRDQFVDWTKLNYKLNEEEINYKMINKDPEVTQAFKKFVSESDLYVMINRAPTLYRLGQLVFEVTLNEGSYIGYSLMATTPLNLDFDGDTLAVYEIPQHLREKVKSMLPSHLNKYMKSDKEVIVPKQETLIGLMIATKWDDSEDKSDIIKVDSRDIDKLYDDGKFDSNDIITIDGVKNTYGRFKLSSILGFDITYQITSKNISDIVSKVKQLGDFKDKLHQMQEFGLQISTFESSEDISLEALSKEAERLDKTKYNYNESDITIFGKGEELIEETLPLRDSIKGTKGNISSIVKPQAFHTGDNFVLTSDSLLGSMSMSDYIKLSAEMRKVQQVKVHSLGDSGYLARQIWTAMSKLIYTDMMGNPQRLLTIVPDTDGVRYRNGNPIKVTKGVSTEVDSVIFNEDNIVFKNDLYESMEFKDGHLIGIDFGMQMSEGVTQGILKLKHSGLFISYSAYGLLTAESDCKVRFDENFIYVNEFKFLKSHNFKLVDPNKVEYKKGELIGVNPTLVSPTTNLYLLRKLIKALGSTSTTIKPNTYINLYSVTKGRVEFVDNKVRIGRQVYEMPIESLCLVHEGQEVDEGTKLFTGPLNYQGFVNKYGNIGVDIIFKVFNSELSSLVSIKSILSEFLFKAIHSIETVGNSSIVAFKGVAGAIDNSDDLLTSLTLGYIKKKLSKFIASDSSELGDSTIINVAYQFNGLKLGNMITDTQHLIGK